MSSLFQRYLLPFLVFPPITLLALKYIWATLTETQYGASIASQCAPGAPLKLNYTGHPAVDDQLCIMVTFFHHSLQPISFPYTKHFILNLAPITVFPFIEAARSGRPIILSTIPVMIMWMACQLVTGGVTLPVYWAFFLASGALRPGKVDVSYTQATTFALVAGFLAPSIAMLKYDDPWLTALWQPFPVLVFIIQRLLIFLIPASSKSSSRAIQGLYAITFLISVVPHIRFIWSYFGSWKELYHVFFPFVTVAGQAINDDVAALNFLQWDGVFVFGAAFLSTLWFARDVSEVAALIIWDIVGTVFLGPGATLSAVYAWREGRVSSA